MKRIILNLAITLDGFIEGPNGETDWCIMADDMDFGAFLESVDTIFYGRVSYDAWGTYQSQEAAAAAEKLIWKQIHSKQKFVFSSQSQHYEEATVISSAIAQRVREIKNQNGKDIWLYGGANLIKTFIRSNLIDVYQLSVHPVALGRGKPLFEDLEQRLKLKLTGTKVFRSGVTELTYEPEGR